MVIAAAQLHQCCASERWVELVEAGGPYDSAHELEEAFERAFAALTAEDWRQAFAAHARIGEPHPGDATGAAEQSGVAAATPETLAALKAANAAYEARFGHVFLIRASGLSAEQMLAALSQRIGNAPDVELRNAADQQRQITRQRIQELIG